jgi:diguanylate cyclase (GGDEF)-like protein
MSKPLDKTLNAILNSADLPTLPVMASKILELTAREDASLNDIVSLVTQDVALSAKILKIANSAFYNFPQQIASISQAVSLLGINAVRSLVLSFTFLTMGNKAECGLFDLAQFWDRSLVGAAAARLIAEQTGQADPEELFTVGLLQNIGHLVFALTLPARYDQLLRQQTASGPETGEVAFEEEFLGIPHTLSGFEVARFWGLPAPILTAILHHHAPHGYCGEDQQQLLTNRIVYLSNLAAKIFFSAQPELYRRRFEEEARQLLGLDHLEITTILRFINREIEKTAQFFGVAIAPIPPVAEIIQEANIRLSLLHLSYEEMHRELTAAKSALEELRRQLTERNRLLEKLAHLDGLTEINNHRFFQNFLHAEINRASQNNAPLSLLIADIDYFKKFNDTHGHQTGDFILRELCRAAQTVIREYDLMARYGGEEFAFVLPETNAEGAMTVAYKLCRAIAEHDFFDGAKHYQVTVSIGAATALPAAVGFNKNSLIDMADEALYEAKKRGRNQVAAYNPRKISRWLPL